MLYHVMSDLETRFRTLDDVKEFIKNPRMTPAVPWSAMDGEDKTTPRICVAPDIESCVTAVKPLGRFRRCLNAHPDAKSYENDDEAYPVLVLTFPDGIEDVVPDKTQVPDAALTGERWILRPVIPQTVELRWLGAYSVMLDEDMARCTGVTFLTDSELKSMHHPWLDRKGHPLESSQYGGEPWPGNRNAVFGNIIYLGWERRLKDQLVIASKHEPGFVECHAAERHATGVRSVGPAYRAMDGDVMMFTGFWDANGEMLFNDDSVEWDRVSDGKTVTARVFHQTNGWMLMPMDSDNPIGMAALAGKPEMRLPSVRLMRPGVRNAPKKPPTGASAGD